MKLFLRVGFFVGMSSLLCGGSLQGLSSVWAADEVPAVHKIAVVNLDKLFHDYEKTKASDSQLEQASKAKQEERAKLVSEIKSMKDELVLLNEQSRNERQQAIEKKLRQLADFDREAKDTLGKQRETAVKAILDQIEATVTSYAKDHGFELVLSERAVLYGIEAINITDQVLKILNSKPELKPHA